MQALVEIDSIFQTVFGHFYPNYPLKMGSFIAQLLSLDETFFKPYLAQIKWTVQNGQFIGKNY